MEKFATHVNATPQGVTHTCMHAHTHTHMQKFTLLRMHSVHYTQHSPNNTYRHSDIELSIRVCHGNAGRRLGPPVACHVDKVSGHLDGLKHDIVVGEKVDLELTEDVPSPLHTHQTPHKCVGTQRDLSFNDLSHTRMLHQLHTSPCVYVRRCVCTYGGVCVRTEACMYVRRHVCTYLSVHTLVVVNSHPQTGALHRL